MNPDQLAPKTAPRSDLGPYCLQYRLPKCISRLAQWLSGRVLDLRQRGRGFQPNRFHCLVFLKQDTLILA